MTHHLHKRIALLIGVLALLLVPASVLATHADTAPEKWPAWYKGEEVTVLMGPAGNSRNPNQTPSACFGPGPDFDGVMTIEGLPIMYGIHADGASQMACPDGTLLHDMILSVVPGDPGYQPLVGFIHCFEGPNFATLGAMPYKSAAAVEAAAQSGALSCGPPVGPVYLSPVVS